MLKESENHGPWPTDFSKDFALRSGAEGVFLWVQSQGRAVLFLFRTFLLKTLEAVSF
jgi:hypothetical protein